jgi:hypothetical protein
MNPRKCFLLPGIGLEIKAVKMGVRMNSAIFCYRGGLEQVNTTEKNPFGSNSNQHPLTFLSQRQVVMIDEALSALGEYGEVRLIVEKGRLRFLVTQKSFDALKWEPGSLAEEVS